MNLDEAILEIEAQYRRFVELVGRKPQYFDGHAVSSNTFFKGLEIVAEKYGLKYSGLSFDGSPIIVGNSNVYLHLGGMKPDYDPYEEMKLMVENAHEGACDLLICHPGYLDSFILKTSSLTIPRTLEVDMVCDPAISEWLDAQEDVVLVTYDDL